MPVPYQVDCSECGHTLTITSRSLDNDGDLWVDVKPCPTCMEQAVKEAVEELEGSS